MAKQIHPDFAWAERKGGSRNCNFDSHAEQSSLLHQACSNGNLELAKTLLSGGANPNFKNARGWTPLFWPCINGDIPLLEELLEKGARHLVRDVRGWTALHHAASNRQHKAAEVLVRHHKRYLSEIELLPKPLVGDLSVEEAKEHIVSSEEQTPIEIAAEVQDSGLMEMLILAKATERGFENLWSHSDFDRAARNTWRILDKAEAICGEGHSINYTSVSPSSVNWRSELLHVAIRDAKLTVAQLLVELGADINLPLRNRTPLHIAAFRKDPQFAELLLQNGADVTRKDQKGLTPLHLAVLNGFHETAAILLEWGSDPNTKTNTQGRRGRSRIDGKLFRSIVERTPLMLACGLCPGGRYDARQRPGRYASNSETQIQMVDLLLSRGADPSLMDHAGKSCLHYAIQTGEPSIVSKLLKTGVDTSVADESGTGALHYAVSTGKLEIIRSVIDGRAREIHLDDNEMNAFHYLAEADLSKVEDQELSTIIDVLCEHSGTAAMSAVWAFMNKKAFSPAALALEYENWAVFEAFEARGASFTTTASLDKLACRALHALQDKALFFLMDRGAKINPGEVPNQGPFNSIALSRSPERLSTILPWLLTLGIDVNNVDSWGKTLLHVLNARHSEQMIQMALDAGADPFKPDNDGCDVFLDAVRSRDYKKLDILFELALKNPPKEHWTTQLGLLSAAEQTSNFERALLVLNRVGLLNATLGSGGYEHRQPMLVLAAQHGDMDSVQQLLAHGADIEVQGLGCWRPLHVAAWMGHHEMVEFLIEAGADVHAETSSWSRDNHRPTGHILVKSWPGQALHLAAMGGHLSIVEMLLAHNVDVNASTGVNGMCANTGWGPTALRMALDTDIFYGRFGEELDENRLRIAELLIERGADVYGVADHLTVNDIVRFKEHPQLWDQLRQGISHEGKKVPV